MRHACASLCAGVIFAASALAAAHYTAPRPDEPVVADELLIRLAPGVDERLLSLLAPGSAAERLNPATQHFRLRVPPGLTDSLAAALAGDSRIEIVEPNRLREPLAIPNDPGYPKQWSLTAVNALDAWSLTPARFATASSPIGSRALVAVVDTGVDCTHPDFANAGGTSKDSANGGQLAFAKSTAYVTTTVSPAACPWQDDYGHGTHVAGIIAAAASNAVGATGLAYGVAIAAFKTSNSSGMSSDYAMAQAIMAAADRGARAVSISLGGAGYSQTLQDAINYAWQRNTLVIGAAGNSNSNAVFYPGEAMHAIGVAAVDANKNKASYSNWGDFIGIAAPGNSIYSTAPTYPVTMNILDYASLSGTSMATPHVSAVAGLLAMAYPGASATGIAARLQQGASSSAAAGGWDQYLGYGVLDAAAATSGNLRPATVGSVVGQVMDPYGMPVAGAYVSGGGATFTTDVGGLYRLANVRSGARQVTVSASGYSMMSFTVTVPAGADVVVPVKLGSKLGSYSGYVSSGGAPLAGAVVEALSGGLIQASVLTAADGSYTLPVISGIYDIRASGLGYISKTASSVAAGVAGAVTVDFSLSRLGAIAGLVTNANGAGVANAQLLFSNSSFSGGAKTDANGRFTSLGLPAGTYTVRAQADGFTDFVRTGVVVAQDTTASVTMKFAAGVASVTISSDSATGPATVVNNTVKLNVPAPAGGAVVTLSSSSSSAGVPVSVTIPAGATSATFAIATTSVTATTAATISGTWSGSTRAATLTLLPPVMSKTYVPSTAAPPGATVTATAYLTGPAPSSGATVTLSASPSSSVSIPASVLVAAGDTTATFTIKVSNTAPTGAVSISGTYGGVAKTGTLNVGALALSSVKLSPTSIVGGGSSTASSVTLNGPALANTVVKLASSTSAVAVPASVTVPAGSTSATFTVTTNAVSTATKATVTATYSGVSKTSSITVNPPALSALRLSPTTTIGGTSTAANTVTLNGIAPAGGIAVALTSSVTSATVPTTIVVPAGSQTATFTISTSGVAASTAATITATFAGVSKALTLTITPAALSAITLSPASLLGGTYSTANTVTLTGAAPPGGLVVALSDNSAYATVPASVTIPAGAKSASFKTTTTGLAITAYAKITATYSGVSRTATLTITP